MCHSWDNLDFVCSFFKKRKILNKDMKWMLFSKKRFEMNVISNKSFNF